MAKKLPNNQSKCFDAYTAIYSVENSRKNVPAVTKTENTETKSKIVSNKILESNTFGDIEEELSSMSVAFDNTQHDDNMLINASRQCKEKSAPANVSVDNTKVNVQNEQIELNTRRRSSRRSSGIDFKVSKNFKNITKKVTLQEQSTARTDQSQLMLSTSLEKDIESEIKYSTVEVPTEFSLSLDDKLTTDLNVSFVHDENEGLICYSQEEDEIESVNNELHTETDESYDREDINPNNNAIDGTSEDDDSGISDSEEINDVEIDESQLHENYSHTEIVTTTDDNIVTKDHTLNCINPSEKIQLCMNKNQEKERNISTEKKNMNKTTTTSKRQVMNQTKVTKQVKENSQLKISKPKVSLVTTSLHFGEQEYMKAMVKRLGGFKQLINVSHDTTHVIAGGPRRTLNILNAIIRGCWIVTPKWVADSIDQGKWLDEEEYEMVKEFPIAKVARINRIRDGKYSHCSLFQRLPSMYLAEVTSPSHEDMIKLITSCGGQLTTSMRRAGIAIGLINCRRKDLRIVSEKWILDSVTNGYIMPTDTYEIRLKCATREPSPDY